MTIYDDITTLLDQNDELDGEQTADQLISTITTTIAQLPPIVRHQIQDYLSGLETGKVVNIKDAK